MLSLFTALTITCTAYSDQLPASGGSGPAVASYTIVETGKRVADPGDCVVIENQNGNVQDTKGDE